MKVMGFHSAHDCAFCVLDNGRPIIHAELERYTREKEPKGDGLKFFYEKYKDSHDVVHFSHCIDVRHGGVKSRYLESFEKMEKQLETTGGSFHVVGHHLAHAANAFYSSNLEEAAILTIDGGGQELLPGPGNFCGTTCAAIYHGDGLKITNKLVLPYTQLDIGGFWTECTKEIFGLSSGYPKGHQAGTVMAMACMGDPKKYGRDFLHTNLEPEFFIHQDLRADFGLAVKTTKDGEWWGTCPPSKLKEVKSVMQETINFEKLKELAEEDEQERFDIAAGIQYATEVIVANLIVMALEKTGSRNLCLSGGCVLNSVLVGKIKKWFPTQIDNIYVAPVPYDAGLAIGTAQYVWHSILGNERIEWKDNFTPYLGEAYAQEDVEAAIAASGVASCQTTDEEVLDLLADEKIISVYGGLSESGRRALGNRSILADPRSPNMKDMINEKVKHRQWFRPFAPSILREEVSNWFVEDIDSPYMSFVIKFKDEVVDKVPAVVHFDNTARLQTVTAADNEWYYNFLTSWHRKTGIPILLNTSFNDREPIVETPQHAIDCFLRTEIDYLYFFDYGILCKKK